MSGKQRIQEKQSLEGTSGKMFSTPPQPLHQMARDRRGREARGGGASAPRPTHAHMPPAPQARGRRGRCLSVSRFLRELELDCEKWVKSLLLLQMALYFKNKKIKE